jgi:ribosome-associated protein
LEGILMEGMLPETNEQLSAELPAALGNLLSDHKGEDVTVLDLREMGSWTDFFVIATAASDTHMDGLERHIKEFCNEGEIEILRRSRKPGGPAVVGGLHRMRWNNYSNPTEFGNATAFDSPAPGGLAGNPAAGSPVDAGLDEWRIIDLGSTVIHLMSRRARKFYELERLYSMAAAVPVLPGTNYSSSYSKSSSSS